MQQEGHQQEEDHDHGVAEPASEPGHGGEGKKRWACPWQRRRVTPSPGVSKSGWPALEGHSATLVGSRCFVFGGVDDRYGVVAYSTGGVPPGGGFIIARECTDCSAPTMLQRPV